MSLSNIRNFAYNILKKLKDDIVKYAEFTELEKCPQCDKDILTPSFVDMCFIGNKSELILAYYNLEKHLDHYKKTEKEHEAQKRVNDEVRGQLPKEVTKYTIWKKTEGARKVYDLFFRISDDKMGRMVNIQQIKTFSASSIAKLSWDNILYVATQSVDRHLCFITRVLLIQMRQTWRRRRISRT
ncbi:hypothetical protein RhiirA5_452472 [Rhizophagus irregularis]|uniref:Uncharacterized protein n=1 Tax=Rhizophagus irregularis TaxID=588596 RepID=A0A2N0P887_9GLOM|nr:hypothetical protein RhiirA5_452472 [Rhizophagus irregularis]